MSQPTLAISCCFTLLIACTSSRRESVPEAAVGDSASSVTPNAAAPLMATFSCDDSLTIYAIFRSDSSGKSSVSLAFGEERLLLPQTLSADGARYADSTTVFWNKGRGVTFDRGGKTRHCTES